MAKQEKPLAKSDVIRAAELETRHLEWLFSAAQEHFIGQIELLELDNVRQQSHVGQPYYDKTLIGRGSREEKLKSNETYLAPIPTDRRVLHRCAETNHASIGPRVYRAIRQVG
jgi:hypothetical protein